MWEEDESRELPKQLRNDRKMALRKLILEEIITPVEIVDWLLGKLQNEDKVAILAEFSDLKDDFAPELLNFLRASTLKIVENGVPQSPVTTPQSKVPPKHLNQSKDRNYHGKARRGHLFGSESYQAQTKRSEQRDSGAHCEQEHSFAPRSKPRTGYTGQKHGLGKQGNASANRPIDVSYAPSKQSRNNSMSKRNIEDNHDFDNIQKQKRSYASLTTDESIIAGDSDTSYFSCSVGSKSADASSVISDSFGLTSYDKQSRSHGENGYIKPDSKNHGKHFKSPNAQSTPRSSRKLGRGKQGISFGEFLGSASPESQPKEADRSCDGAAPQKTGKKGKGWKKSWKWNNQEHKSESQQSSYHSMNSNSSHSQTYSMSSLEDFPPVSPIIPARSKNQTPGESAKSLKPSVCSSVSTAFCTKSMPPLQATHTVCSMSSPVAAALDFVTVNSITDPLCTSTIPACQEADPNSIRTTIITKKDKLSNKKNTLTATHLSQNFTSGGDSKDWDKENQESVSSSRQAASQPSTQKTGHKAWNSVANTPHGALDSYTSSTVSVSKLEKGAKPRRVGLTPTAVTEASSVFKVDSEQPTFSAVGAADSCGSPPQRSLVPLDKSYTNTPSKVSTVESGCTWEGRGWEKPDQSFAASPRQMVSHPHPQIDQGALNSVISTTHDSSGTLSDKTAGSKEEKGTTPRRVGLTPTVVTEASSVFKVDTEHSGSTQAENNSSSLAQRFLLPGEKNQTETGMKSAEVEQGCPRAPCTPDKPTLVIPGPALKFITACPTQVTYRRELDLYAQVYSACLDAHLFPNLSMELYFLTQLLTAQTIEDSLPEEENDIGTEIESKNVFQTVHNVVFFAVEVLHRQTELLRMFDHLTLQLLAENERVQAFAPDLHSHMKAACENKEDISSSSIQNAASALVTFKADIDGRKNFQTDQSFTRSRKQRDTFCKMMKDWEERHDFTDWSLEDRCGPEIQRMFHGADLANYLHFSRLFVSQLIESCTEEQMISTQADNKEMSQALNFKRANPEKSVKLTERLTKPASCRGPCPTASFTGHQEFFKEFLRIANNPFLNTHVSDVLAAHILEINQMEFSEQEHANKSGRESCGENQQESQLQTSQEQKEGGSLFATALLSIRVLARFLGYLTYLPYQGADSLPHHMLYSCIRRRQLALPPVDLTHYLQDAAQKGRLSMTVPWVVEFLAMMDYGAPSTPYVQRVLADLRQVLRLVWAEIKESGITYSQLLIVTCLGWLFDQPCMPPGYYFTGYSSVDQPVININAETEQFGELITQDLFYSCCHYIGETRYLLTEFSLGSRAKTTARKVNPQPPPSTTTHSARVEDLSTQHVQFQLMKSFYHNCPKSVQSLVESVCEGIASNFIRDLRYKTMPFALKRCAAESSMLSSVPEAAKRLYLETQNSMLLDMERYCKERIQPVICHMMPSNIHPTLLQFLMNMGSAIVQSKVKKWIRSFVTYNAFHKELETEVASKERKVALYGFDPRSSRTVKSSGSTAHLHDKIGCEHSSTAGRSHLSIDQLSKNQTGRSDSSVEHSSTISLNSELSKSSAAVPERISSSCFPSVKDEELPGAQPDGMSRKISAVSSGDRGPPALASVGDVISLTPTRDGNPPTMGRVGEVSGMAPAGDGNPPAVASVHEAILMTPAGDGNPPVSNGGKVSHVTPAGVLPSVVCVGEMHSVTPAGGGNPLSVACVGEVKLRSSAEICDSPSEMMLREPLYMTHAGDAGFSSVVSSAGYTPVINSDTCHAGNTVCVEKQFSTDSPHFTSSIHGSSELSASSSPNNCSDAKLPSPLTGRMPAMRKTPGTKSVAAEVDIGRLTLDEKLQGGVIVYMLREVQDLLYGLRVEREPILQEDLYTLLDYLLNKLACPQEIPDNTLDAVMIGLAQLASAIVFLQPTLWTEETASLFVQVWSADSTEDKELSSLCSIIMLGYLDEAEDKALSLQLYCDLLASLMEKDIFTLSQIKAAFDEMLQDFEVYRGQVEDILRRLSAKQKVLQR